MRLSRSSRWRLELTSGLRVNFAGLRSTSDGRACRPATRAPSRCASSSLSRMAKRVPHFHGRPVCTTVSWANNVAIAARRPSPSAAGIGDLSSFPWHAPRPRTKTPSQRARTRCFRARPRCRPIQQLRSRVNIPRTRLPWPAIQGTSRETSDSKGEVASALSATQRFHRHHGGYRVDRFFSTNRA